MQLHSVSNSHNPPILHPSKIQPFCHRFTGPSPTHRSPQGGPPPFTQAGRQHGRPHHRTPLLSGGAATARGLPLGACPAAQLRRLVRRAASSQETRGHGAVRHHQGPPAQLQRHVPGPRGRSSVAPTRPVSRQDRRLAGPGQGCPVRRHARGGPERRGRQPFLDRRPGVAPPRGQEDPAVYHQGLRVLLHDAGPALCQCLRLRAAVRGRGLCAPLPDPGHLAHPDHHSGRCRLLEESRGRCRLQLHVDTEPTVSVAGAGQPRVRILRGKCLAFCRGRGRGSTNHPDRD